MRRGLTAGARGAEQPLSHSEGWQRRGAARGLGTRQSGGSLAAPKPPRTRIRAGSTRPPFCRRSEGGRCTEATRGCGGGGVGRAMRHVVPPAPRGALGVTCIHLSTPSARAPECFSLIEGSPGDPTGNGREFVI